MIMRNNKKKWKHRLALLLSVLMILSTLSGFALSASQETSESPAITAQAEAKEKAKTLAEDLLAQAQETDDFSKLVEKEGYDVGLEDATNGYYISKNSSGYPDALLEAAFALGENEISSELVADETYGYFIIQRLPIDMDYVESNIESMVNAYDAPTVEKVYKEYIDGMKVTYFDQWDKLTADSIS